MVFQKKGGAATKRNFPQVNEKVPKKQVFEEEDDDDSDDDDIDMEDDSDFDDTDSDDVSGKLNAKGKQTPTQGKSSSLIKTPKGQAQTPALSSGKKNQLAVPAFLQQQQKQFKMEFATVKAQGKGKMVDKEAVEDDSDDDDDDDNDDDDDDTSDSGDAGGKLNTKAKQQTSNQGKGTPKTPKGQAQTPAVSSGKKNQPATPLQRQTKQNVMKEFPGMKGSAGKVKIVGKGADDDEDDDSDDDDDDDDDDDSDDEMNTKTPLALDKSTGKKTPNGKKGMHVSFELPKKGGSPAQQNIPALAKKNQQAAAVPGTLQGKSAKGTPGKAVFKGKKKADSDDDDDDEDDDDLSDDDDDDDQGSDDDDDDADSDDEEVIKKKLASLKKEMLPKKGMKSSNESNTRSQDPKSKKPKTLLSNQQLPNSKGESKTNKPPQNKAFQESLEKELERKRERDARNLFIRGLPTDVTIDEIKALSPDILDISLPKSKFQKKKGNKTLFGFLEFANEKKAEENYVKLQKKKLRGQDIFIDFSGEKSKNKNVAAAGSNMQEKNVNKKRLYVSGLPVDVTMAEVAQLFPNCYNIILNNAPEYRNCNASFHTEEEAAEAFKSNENAKIRGRAVTVLYAIEQSKSQFKRKRPNFERNKFSPSAKRNKSEM